MKCVNHKEVEAKYFCMKYRRDLCEDCLTCQDPSIHCKFRQQCLIWEFERHRDSRPRPEDGAS